MVLNFNNLNGLADLLGDSLVSSRYAGISQKAVLCLAGHSWDGLWGEVLTKTCSIGGVGRWQLKGEIPSCGSWTWGYLCESRLDPSKIPSVLRACRQLMTSMGARKTSQRHRWQVRAWFGLLSLLGDSTGVGGPFSEQLSSPSWLSDPVLSNPAAGSHLYSPAGTRLWIDVVVLACTSVAGERDEA